MDFSALNWLAVFAAAVLSFVIGGLWYSPLLFGKAWMTEMGFAEEELQGDMARIFGLSFVCSFVIALNLAMFLGPEATLGWGLAAGALAGVGWVAMALGIIYLFSRHSTRLYLIDAGYNVVTFTLMGGLLGLWN